jgi:ABC-2 type transport system permease protein
MLQILTKPLSTILRYISKVAAVAELEFRKLLHDPTELLTRAVQPILWLLVFGEVFAQTRIIPTPGLKYMDFMAPGVLGQSVLFISIFYGIAVIWERDLGIVQRFLTTPTPRTALVAGKALSAGIRGLSQAVVIYVLAAVIGVNLVPNPFSIILVAAFVLLGAAVFATLSLIIACIVRTQERFMGIGQLLTMPLFLASNAIYPISLMPDWLKVIAYGNPLTYLVDALRGLMIGGAPSEYGIAFDFAFLSILAIVLILICARLYARVAQ